MKKGDIIFQRRAPGGLCLLIRIFDSQKEYDCKVEGWSKRDWPILRVYHKTLGLIDDPSYYYCTVE